MEPRQALTTIFGFDQFRPGQEDVVRAGLAGRDALVVMPTGSGKSLCYQLPALMRDDLTLVVSPLVSLMRDQVRAIARVAPGQVEVVSSGQSAAANEEALARAGSGATRLLYVAPERFGARGFMPALRLVRVGLFVVDEAHCVSHWGHDFRPDYSRLAEVARRLRTRATMALTATATANVSADIAVRLALRDPVMVRTGFDRPNLTYAVQHCAGSEEKRRLLLAALSAPDALPAIVYAGTREDSETLARYLALALRQPVLPYHAGLDRGLRAATQERFMEGHAPVIVATNAFGMGIDKPDVRTVCHASVPPSLEAYYQEAGRAGRDGQPARCLLLAERRDKGLHAFFVQSSLLTEGAFAVVLERLRWAGMGGRFQLELSEVVARAGPGADDDLARALLGHLTRAGLLVPEPAPAGRISGRLVSEPGADARSDAELLAACHAASREAEQVRWDQYHAIWSYVDGAACRRAALLAYFGDRDLGARRDRCCDMCDGAAGDRPASEMASAASPSQSWAA
jgi:ATP-dependent DNA helicase RecQ